MCKRLASLKMWSRRDLELKVFGNPMDIQLMQKHVCYDGISKDIDSIKFMWSALESFSEEDRSAFMRFCWAFAPATRGLCNVGPGFRVFAATDLPATTVPRALTCFFQIDLPPYNAAASAKECVLSV